MEIERVMRTCEGGNPEEGCPAFDCSMCMVGEVTFYANKVSSNGAMELDIDQQAGSAGQHVENISFDGGVHADYNVYVTNYATNSDQGEIHFVVVTKQGQTVETFEDSWDINTMGTESRNRLENMMAITTVHVAGHATGRRSEDRIGSRPYGPLGRPSRG